MYIMTVAFIIHFAILNSIYYESYSIVFKRKSSVVYGRSTFRALINAGGYMNSTIILKGNILYTPNPSALVSIQQGLCYCCRWGGCSLW